MNYKETCEYLFSQLPQFEKDGAIAAKVKSAMTYPIVILCVLIGVVGMLMVMVIPTFSNMFEEMGATLPKPTQVIVAISNFLVSKWWLLLIIIAVLVIM